MRSDKLQPARILVLRALKLGDLICAVPAFRALRKNFPSAEITLLSLPWASEFQQRFDCYIDRHLSLPGYPGLPEQQLNVESLLQLLNYAQRQSFDLAFQLHGSGQHVNDLVELCAPKQIVGFVPDFASSTETRGRNHYLVYPKQMPESWRLLELLRSFGLNIDGDELSFPVHKSDHDELAVLLAQVSSRGLGRKLLCIHPGAISAKRWGVNDFAEVGRYWTARGFTVVITGSAAEVPLTAALGEQIGSGALDLGGRTSLGTMAALLDRSSLLLSNDTGVAHLAEAVGCPSAVVFNEVSRLGWPSRNQRIHRFLTNLNGVSVAQVLVETEDLMRGAAGTRSSCSFRNTAATNGAYQSAIAPMRKETAHA